jgi:hypothetical protein
MEEEISKHSKNILHEIGNKRHSILHKLKDIVLEIAIIVFSITLTLWLHNWNEQRTQRKEVKEFLVDLKADLNDDIENMTSSKEMLQKGVKSYEEASKLMSENKHGKVLYNLISRRTHQADYESFKSSGKIGFMENK